MDETEQLFDKIFNGELDTSSLTSLLDALDKKGETPDELAGATKSMRKNSKSIDVNHNQVIDCCGTGGLGKSMMNVSTSAAFVAAAAEVKVAKHGNRTATGKSGSADLLEAANLNLALKPDQVAKCIEEIGIGFIFAQNFHPGMKYVMPARKRIANKTIFNLLGPLTNPASAKRQSLGVYDSKWILPVAETLKNLGAHKALVFHSNDGLDEISITDDSFISELKEGKIKNYHVSPKDFGLSYGNFESIKASSPQESFEKVSLAFAGKEGSVQDMIAINSAAALKLSGIVKSMKDGVCLLYTSPSPRDKRQSRMPSSA